ncbi:hypothetical protein C0991_002631, partial [Blastosporella zonata]
MFQTELLTQLQNARFIPGSKMREHLAGMSNIAERLAEIGCPMTEENFCSYIRTSLALAPEYKSIITSLDTIARRTHTAVTSQELIHNLNMEANSAELEASMTKSTSAMLSAHAKAKGKDSKSKEKLAGKGKSKRHCEN